MKRLDALEAAYNCDPTLIAAELEAHTLDEIADRHGIARLSVIKVERRHGVRCQRICATCKRRVPASSMRVTSDGKIGQACKACPTRKKPDSRSTGHRARAEAEYLEVPPTIYAWVRTAISRDQGYWPRYATRAEA